MNCKHPAHVWWWILITKEFYLYIFLIRIVLHKVFNERKVKQLSHHHNGKSLYIPCFLFVCWNFSPVMPPTMSYIVNVNGIFLCATISLGLECAQRMLCHQRNGGKLSRTPGHIWFIYQRVSWSFCILGIQEERERERDPLITLHLFFRFPDFVVVVASVCGVIVTFGARWVRKHSADAQLFGNCFKPETSTTETVIHQRLYAEQGRKLPPRILLRHTSGWSSNAFNFLSTPLHLCGVVFINHAMTKWLSHSVYIYVCASSTYHNHPKFDKFHVEKQEYLLMLLLYKAATHTDKTRKNEKKYSRLVRWGSHQQLAAGNSTQQLFRQS